MGDLTGARNIYTGVYITADPAAPKGSMQIWRVGNYRIASPAVYQPDPGGRRDVGESYVIFGRPSGEGAAPPSSPPSAPSPPARPVFELSTSAHFAAWLAGLRSSLVFTTYQTGKVFLIGLGPNGRLSIFERALERVMGLHASASTLHLSTLYQLWRFENALAPGETFNGYDALYTPRESRVTGELDVHDLAVEPGGFCLTGQRRRVERGVVGVSEVLGQGAALEGPPVRAGQGPGGRRRPSRHLLSSGLEQGAGKTKGRATWREVA